MSVGGWRQNRRGASKRWRRCFELRLVEWWGIEAGELVLEERNRVLRPLQGFSAKSQVFNIV